MAKDKKSLVIGVLIAIIVILLIVLLYTFSIRPAVNGYVVQKQGEAVEQVLTLMLAQIQQQGYTVITDRVANQSIVLVPYVAPTGQQQAAQGSK